MTAPPIPIALTVAGSDCCAGAGIQADLKAFTACGVYGLTAVTCLVAETPNSVTEVLPQPAMSVSMQLTTLLETYPIKAMKTGLLATPEIIWALDRDLQTVKFPIVVDPVAIASTGTKLVTDGFPGAMREFIKKRATLVTPNRGEAEELLKRSIKGTADAKKAAAELAEELGCSILLKGGHFDGKECIDHLCHEEELHEIRGIRVPEGDVHGTGCTYSAAITARLAQGYDLKTAVTLARKYLHQTITDAYSWAGQDGHQLKALAHFPNSVHNNDV